MTKQQYEVLTSSDTDSYRFADTSFTHAQQQSRISVTEVSALFYQITEPYNTFTYILTYLLTINTLQIMMTMSK